MLKSKYNLATLLILGLLISGCGDSPNLYHLDSVPSAKKLQTVANLVEVSQFDLPEYVQANEIAVLDEDGVLRLKKDDLWADSPDRALTAILSLALDEGLSAQVAAEPWPFESPADVRVTVKVQKLVGSQGGELQFSGQYFLSATSGGTLAEVERFDISVPLADPTVQELSAAHSKAIGILSLQIAKSISRVRRSTL